MLTLQWPQHHLEARPTDSTDDDVGMLRNLALEICKVCAPKCCWFCFWSPPTSPKLKICHWCQQVGEGQRNNEEQLHHHHHQTPMPHISYRIHIYIEYTYINVPIPYVNVITCHHTKVTFRSKDCRALTPVFQIYEVIAPRVRPDPGTFEAWPDPHFEREKTTRWY